MGALLVLAQDAWRAVCFSGVVTAMGLWPVLPPLLFYSTYLPTYKQPQDGEQGC